MPTAGISQRAKDIQARAGEAGVLAWQPGDPYLPKQEARQEYLLVELGYIILPGRS